jgi:hypothetical protein
MNYVGIVYQRTTAAAKLNIPRSEFNMRADNNPSQITNFMEMRPS